MKNVSIVIPAFNEEERLPATLAKIHAYAKQSLDRYEVIVVDDGSKDQTVRIAQLNGCRVLCNGKNRGKGYSVKQGMLVAKYETVLFTDADLSTPITELDKFLPLLAESDFLIASRNCVGAQRVEDQGILRKLMGKIFSVAVRLIAGCKVTDSQCGFKVFKRDVAQEVFSRQTFEGFSFDVEILHIAERLGFTFKEVPVIWKNDRRSTVRPIRDSIRMFRDVVRVRFNSWTGAYRFHLWEAKVKV
ncbi:MAG TPA: dolichyl-phosphate beta-glucosyltransferase [Candidatus Nanoarchaeia archaeon]|nr:dolichyl-phosphate beta-glucosyltransferase [Candidatus Nanoarchaeia archaeon]